jgi:hypothetical protein
MLDRQSDSQDRAVDGRFDGKYPEIMQAQQRVEFHGLEIGDRQNDVSIAKGPEVDFHLKQIAEAKIDFVVLELTPGGTRRLPQPWMER